MDEERKKRLDKIFQNMRANMSKIDLLSMYSHEIFENFPWSLPNNSLYDFKNDVLILNKVKSKLTTNEFNLLSEKNYVELGMSKKFYRFVHNLSVVHTGEIDIESIDFQQVLYSQELISLYSYLEGYFQDLQRILYEQDKTLLSNKDKQVLLNTILEVDDYEQLVKIIIDEKLAKSGYEKISSIIEKWKKEPFKIILKLKKAELQKLDKFTLIRNIIIHNNSRVDDSLINYLNSKEYKVGQEYKLNSEIMKEFRDLVFEIVFSAYTEICLKYPKIIVVNE
nr:hypothetical protein [uncultured Draconibacterium sp.]